MNTFALKLIAAAAMLIDHIGDMFVGELSVCRIIGRLSFPIFAFLIVEGALHTCDYKRYVCRMAVFAVLSEIPYELAIYTTPFLIDKANVLFTFLIGLICIWFMQKLLVCFAFGPAGYMAGSAAFFAGALIAEAAGTDYGMYGIMLIYIFYIFRQNKVVKTALSALLFAAMPMQQIAAIAALVPIWFYNGRLGYSARWTKWGFYLFYPVHLLILYVVRVMTF